MYRFYSIIIPARDEEQYIEKTMNSLISLNYPKNLYEIILVESGSSDRTYEIAKKFKSKRVKVYHINAEGVSRARNYGASKTSKKSEWLIFVDADDILKKNFLLELNNYLDSNKNKNLVVGTTSVSPIERDKNSERIFKFYSAYLRIIKASYSIQIIKKELFKKAKYNENLKVGEDYENIKRLRKFGEYFFLETDQVKTSNRRFKKIGYTKLFFIWTCGAILPMKIREKISYRIIR